MKETEITVQVFDTKENLFRKLDDLGFQMIENFQLNDWYFTKLENTENVGFQKLIDNSILIREVVENGKAQTQICYKKKEYDDCGNVISEEKTKTHVDDRDKILKILSLAGLNNYCEIHNDSYCFCRDGFEFSIQVVDDLGIFIEYEEDDSVPKNMTCEEKTQFMLNAVKGLGLNIGKDYSCKKVQMKINQNKEKTEQEKL